MQRALFFPPVWGALCSFVVVGTANAQPAPAPAVVPASAPAPAVPACKPIPYQVGDAVKGAEVAANFSVGAIGKLAKLPDLSLRGGVEVVKSAYAGMVAQAMSDVFDVLGCRVTTFIKDTDVDADNKRAAVQQAIARLNGEMSFIQAAYAGGFQAVGSIRDQYLNAARAEGAPVLDAAITRAALISIDTDALFINGTTTKWWGGLNFGKYASVQACGGVIQQAISDGGSAMQVALASTRDILVNYLDPKTPPVVALAKLMVMGVPITAHAPPANTFQGCTNAMNQAALADAAKAAITPAAAASAPAARASAPTI